MTTADRMDWTPQPEATRPDPARRLFQVRLALEQLFLNPEHRACMAELATNLEKKFTAPRPNVKRTQC